MEKTFSAKSITIARKPGKDPDGLKSAFLGLFEDNNPHLKGKVPFKVLDIAQVEKIRIHDLRNVSYYLIGNDIVINNLTKVTISKDEHIVTITGKQEL